MDERIVDILTRLRRSLKEDELVPLGEVQTFLISDLSVLLKVFLVANEHNCHPLVGMFKHFLHPAH